MRLDDPDFVEGQVQRPGQVVPAPVWELGGRVYGEFPVGLVVSNAGAKGLEGRMFLFGCAVCILNDDISLFKPILDVSIHFLNFKGDIAPVVYLDVLFFHGFKRIVQGRQSFVLHLNQRERFSSRHLIIGRQSQHRIPDKPNHIVSQKHLFFLFLGSQKKPVFNYLGNL